MDLGSDDDYIIVDHSDDEDLSFNIKPEEKVDLGSDDDYIVVDYGGSDVESDIDERVDLGSDDDYIVVDHGGDDVSSNDVSNEEKNLASDDNSQIMDKQPVNSKSKHSNFVKSIISDVVVGETKLKPQEVKTVKGEFIDDVTELHKPSPKEDFVVEAEIVNDDDSYALGDDSEDELNIFNDNLPDWDNDDSGCSSMISSV